MRETWQGKDFYAVIGVDRDASPIEVRRAYRAAARGLGETGADDPRRAELEEAYAVLRDAALRAEYDDMPAEPAAGGPGGVGSFLESTPMRRWGSIAAGTAVAAAGYTAFIAALISDDAAATPLPLIGLLAILASHVPLALISRHPERWMAVAKGIGVTAAVATAMVALRVLFPVAVSAGLGFGGLFSYRQDDPRYRRPRLFWISGVALYTMVSLYVIPDFAIVLAPIFPYNALGIADHFTDRRARRRAGV